MLIVNQLVRHNPRHNLVTNACPQNPVETRKPIDYLNARSQTVERRLECLEREFSELRAQVLDLRRRKKDWRGTVGTLEDDEIAREAERLGRQDRDEQTYQKEIAGS